MERSMSSQNRPPVWRHPTDPAAKWTTRLEWNGKNWVVELSQGDWLVAKMSLDDWAQLSATTGLVADARTEAREALRQEVLGLPAD
jgi:hypothetical protein